MCLPRKFLPLVCIFLLNACSATETNNEALNANQPIDIQGLSLERLSRIDSVMNEYIDKQKLAGTVTLWLEPSGKSFSLSFDNGQMACMLATGKEMYPTQ